MANLKEIRNRINSVKNTRKITSAMSRIAAARLFKAQQAMAAARPYGERMEAVVSRLAAEAEGWADRPALLAERKVERAIVVAVTADRGLCGGFNSNVNRQVVSRVKALRDEGVEVLVFTVGRKSQAFLGHAEIPSEHHIKAPTHEDVVESARGLADELIGRFSSEGPNRVDRVEFVYNHFKNVITQEVRSLQLLPVAPGAVDSGGDSVECELEPDPRTLLDTLLPLAVQTAIAQAFFNSVAAEIAARRSAMDSATDNATELVGQLTLEYNRERQAAITNELMEIIGGAEALSG